MSPACTVSPTLFGVLSVTPVPRRARVRGFDTDPITLSLIAAEQAPLNEVALMVEAIADDEARWLRIREDNLRTRLILRGLRRGLTLDAATVAAGFSMLAHDCGL